MPEEQHGQLGFEYAWRELLKRSKTSGERFLHFLEPTCLNTINRRVSDCQLTCLRPIVIHLHVETHSRIPFLLIQELLIGIFTSKSHHWV
jgi:hypothetical protein